MHPILAFSLAIMASVTLAEDRCCAPDLLVADVVFAGNTQYRVYIDFVNKVALQDWGGNYGIDYVLDTGKDGKEGVSHTMMKNGTCRNSPITVSKYWQCVPQGAVHTPMKAEFGVPLDGWIYNPNSQINRLVVVNRNGCLPYRLQQTKNDELHVVHFINQKATFDRSILQRDISSCVDA